jgi:uncharacterized protein YkwD
MDNRFARFVPIIVAVLLMTCSCVTVREAAGDDAGVRKEPGSSIRDTVRSEENDAANGAVDNASNGARSGALSGGAKTDGNGSPWNIQALDTARNAVYLDQVERDVVLELNKVRTNPAAYADSHLVTRRRYYRAKIYRRPGNIDLVTSEGVRAIDECIRVLKSVSSRNRLKPSRGLSRAADDHVRDTGPRGITGHVGTRGSTLSNRVSRYGDWGAYIGEAISYGNDEAREIVIQLLVDDGVPSRGHRKILLQEEFSRVGVAVGAHKTYGAMCVIDFAGTYDESK